MARYYFDLESNGLIPQMDRIHSLVLQDVDTGEMFTYSTIGHGLIAEGLVRLENADEIIGHNIMGFDVDAIKKIYPDWSPKGKLTDTLVMSRLFYPNLRGSDFDARDRAIKRGKDPSLPGNLIGSHSLKAWGYRLGFLKGDFGDTDDWSTCTPEMVEYNEQDVRVTARLYETLVAKNDLTEWGRALDIEQRFYYLTSKQERHGFRFDVARAEELEQEIRVRKTELHDDLLGLFEPWWVKVGVMKPKRTGATFVEDYDHGGSTREKAVPTGETYVHTFKNGKTQVRQVKETVTQKGYFQHTDEECPYAKVELRIFNPTSRIHIADRLTKLYGWQPTEFTDSGQVKIDDEILSALPYEPCAKLAEYFMLDKRLGQIADGKQAWLKKQKDGRIHGRINTLGAVTGRCTHSNPNVAQVPSIHNAKGVVPYGADCRSLFLPDEGHVLVGCDAAGLELRCLAHFMKDGGRYAKIVLDGKKEDGTDIHTMNQKAASLPSRDNAKTFIYAFLYGAGDGKIGEIIGKGPQAGRALKNKFLKNTPGLTGLITAVKAAAKKKGWIKGIDGRRVPIRHNHAALNSLLQNAGAVAMKLAPVLLYERLTEEGYVWGEDWAQVAHVHDEVQLTVKPEHADYVCEAANWSIAEAGRQLGFLCPLEGEADAGQSWKDTH